MSRILHSHSATAVSIDLSTKRRAAAFRFVEPTGDVRVITVPFGALARLHHDISKRLAAEPQLFDGVSPVEPMGS